MPSTEYDSMQQRSIRQSSVRRSPVANFNGYLSASFFEIIREDFPSVLRAKDRSCVFFLVPKEQFR
jgi:hypothetical protein